MTITSLDVQNFLQKIATQNNSMPEVIQDENTKVSILPKLKIPAESFKKVTPPSTNFVQPRSDVKNRDEVVKRKV